MDLTPVTQRKHKDTMKREKDSSKAKSAGCFPRLFAESYGASGGGASEPSRGAKKSKEPARLLSLLLRRANLKTSPHSGGRDFHKLYG
jgi:hypothetical protein